MHCIGQTKNSLITSKARWTEHSDCEWITCNDNREYEDGDCNTIHLDHGQSFYDTGDEDSDDSVGADDSLISCTAAHSVAAI